MVNYTGLVYAQHANQSHIISPANFNNKLLQNTVHGLIKDEDNFIWTFTQYGCYRYDGLNTQTYLSNDNSFLSSDRYRSVYPDKKNKRWIAIGETDFYFVKDRKLQSKKDSDSIVVGNYYNYLMAPRSRLQLFLPSREKNIYWAALLFFKTDTLVLLEGRCFNYTTGKIISNPEISGLEFEELIQRNGTQYVLNEKGLAMLSYEHGILSRKHLITLNNFSHIIPNNDSNAVWIENEKEVKKINLPSGKITSSFLKPNYLQFSNSILEDETNGDLYLGTIKNGVLLIRSNKINKLAPENYTSSYAFNQIINSYCVVTQKGIAYSSSIKGQAAFLPQKNILNLYIFSDDQQRIWYQNNKATIMLLNPSTNKLLDSIPFDDFMVEVKQLDSNRFILANHYSVFTCNIKNKKLTPIFKARKNESINDLCFVNREIYVSTSNGIYVMDNQYRIKKHLLKGVTIRKSILLHNNMLAIGSYGKGLFLLKNNQLYAASTEKYPQLSAVNSLAVDSDSALWVICNKAAFVWNNPDVKNKLVNTPDHILAVESNLPCNELNGGLNPDVFPKSQIVLPSSDGLLIFNKNELITADKHQKIAIGKVIIDDSVMSETSSFQVPAGTSSIRFMIDAAFLSPNLQSGIEYRMKELDSNWKFLPDNRELEFLKLPKGKYHLEFRTHASNSRIELSVFNVSPFWYQTIWAELLFLTAITLIIYLIVQWRISSQRLYQKKLEQIIEEKTKSLQENIQKLNHSEKNLKKQYRYRNKLYSILMHDLKSPLTFLSTYSIQQLNKNKSDQDEPMKVIAKSSSELSTFINEFLFWLGNQTNPENIVLQETDVSLIMNELTTFYQSFASINNNKLFYFDKTNDIVFNTDPDRLKIIIRNLLDNANKYTSNGVIKVSSRLENEFTLIITIEDSGKGMPENIVALINTHDKIEEFSPSINANYKMGLMISKELISQLNGKVTVDSNENTGTCFTIRFVSKNYRR